VSVAAHERGLNGHGLCDDAATMRSRLSQPVGGAPSWAIVLLGAAAVALVPWSVALAAHLPTHHVAPHWDIAWAGIDAGIAAVLIATVAAAVRGSAWLPGLSMAAAAMLLCDAWFDVFTSAHALELWLAVALAAFVEVPLAIVCVVVSRSSVRGRIESV
jgi:hypothetical protein